jgi:hypothetical protein
MVLPPQIREVRTHDDIRAAIEGKATKYGDMDLPLVVLLNVLDDFCDDQGRLERTLWRGPIGCNPAGRRAIDE